MKPINRLLSLSLLAYLAIVPHVSAGVIIHVFESGGNVEATLSGTFNLAATQGFLGNSGAFNGFLASGGNIAFTTGATDFYGMNTNWTPFGSGGFDIWSTSSGDAWALYSDPVLGVPDGYVSGTNLSATATRFSSSFAALGFSPGSYVTTLTNAGESDTVTVVIGQAPTAVPEPTSLALLGMGAMGMAGFAWRRRKQAVTA